MLKRNTPRTDRTWKIGGFGRDVIRVLTPYHEKLVRQCLGKRPV